VGVGVGEGACAHVCMHYCVLRQFQSSWK